MSFSNSIPFCFFNANPSMVTYAKHNPSAFILSDMFSM